MPRLSKTLDGPRLWFKRDDCTGLAFGGNKERKAEFVIADALQKNADIVITTGAVQSNHTRATAAAARKVGLKAVLILQGEKPETYDGNLLLDYLLGTDIRFVSVDWREVGSIVNETARKLEQEGHTPYIIPSGASYSVGAVAYANAMLEMLTQAQEIGFKINHVVHAVGSGGTQAGLVLTNKMLNSQVGVYGICVEEDGDWLIKKTVKIANATSNLLGISVNVQSKDVNVIEGYAGKAYGTATPECMEAIKLVAQTEGILLDPVYTSKAMAGLIDMVRCNRFKKDENVVFIHTGGTPALFPYKQQLVQGIVEH